MEARKITVVSTKNQKKSVIMSGAETLAELKRDLTANGIDYSGMTFYEGTAKVELKTDDSALPKDVNYKGTVTNELVFMLTNTDKKIKSGAPLTRGEAYAAIKKLGLESAVLSKYGKCYTNCKTSELVSVIDNTKTANARQTPTGDCTNAVAKALSILVDGLYNKEHVISYNTVKAVKEALGTNGPEESSYSDSEIDQMFAGIN